MVNYKFLIVCYIIGLSVDWILQWDWQAKNKCKWEYLDNKKKSIISLISHSLIYATVTSFITMYLIRGMENVMFVFVVLFTSHAIIDTRIPVKYIMRFKGMNWRQIYDYKTYGFMHIGIDHRLHELVILLISLIV